MPKITLVVGTRPNLVKVVPIIQALQKQNHFTFELIHTGQHYDYEMSRSLFDELSIPFPDKNFQKGPYSYTTMGEMMQLFSDHLIESQTNIVMVFGDVDSSLACALVTVKDTTCKLVHVESGCRSFDRTMPEEINRIVIDTLSDYCFCNTNVDEAHLIDEGISREKIFVVGNVMADTLLMVASKMACVVVPEEPFILATFHRPINVDSTVRLKTIWDGLVELSKDYLVLFPIHPRTWQRIITMKMDLSSVVYNLRVTKPMSYLEFLAHLKKAQLMITDSGGVQVESAILKTKCLTVRNATEHLWTLREGNLLTKREDFVYNARYSLDTPMLCSFQDRSVDGKAAQRIVSVLMNRE